MSDRYLTKEKILETIGVELGEKFKITGVDTGFTYRIVESCGGLYMQYIFGDIDWENASLSTFSRLLTGDLKVRKTPFIPTNGETYWSINDGGYAYSSLWLNNSTNKRHFSIGNCYRTKVEAQANIDKHKGVIEKAYQERLKELQGWK